MRTETLKVLQLPDLSVRIMSSVLEEEHLDSKPAFEAADLPANLPSQARRNVSGAQELSFQRAFVRITGYRPDLWILTGLRYRLLAYGLLGLALMTVPTLRHYMRINSRSYLSYSMAATRPIEDGEEICGGELDVTAVPDDIRDFTVYRDFAAISMAMHDLWTERFPFTDIRLSVPKPTIPVEAMLGWKVTFDAERTSWHWPGELSDRPLFHGDELLHRIYVAQCAARVKNANPHDDLVGALTSVVSESNGDNISLVRLARQLGLSERTLQRRLEERGITFRVLVDDVRKQQAIQLLSTTMLPISEVAWKAGYADLASFNHAFRRWTGASPNAYRRRLIA
jgi:AraC-like DNA-binding protein